jgi:hypothetical protein
MILILSAPDDLHASTVATKLQERGASFVRFDPALFPQEAEISTSCSPAGHFEQVLRIEGKEIELARIQAAWYRRPGKPVAHREIRDRAAREFVEMECSKVTQDLWSSIDCEWLPSPPFMMRHAEQKALQLKIAQELGFELPPTLITNSPVDLLSFYRQHNGNIVSKQAGKSFFSTLGSTMIRYTELVTGRDIAYAPSIAFCPMTFQAYVPKRVELRITVVGQQVFAAEIHSQATNHTRHDWRRYDHGRTPHRPHVLPCDVERRCVRLVERLGLRYGAIDLVLTPDGRHVFLEINPNGQYLWIEHEAGLPISDAICDLLMGLAPDSGAAKKRESITGEVL